MSTVQTVTRQFQPHLTKQVTESKKRKRQSNPRETINGSLHKSTVQPPIRNPVEKIHGSHQKKRPAVAVASKDVNKNYSTPSTGGDEPRRSKKADPSSETTKSEFESDSTIKRAGEFLLGPKQGGSPVKCIEQYLARRDGTDEFKIIKILTLKDKDASQTTDDIQGKTLLHTEQSLLSLLKNESGVVHEYGMFRSPIKERHTNKKGEVTTKEVNRLCLVLDCYMPHDFSPKYSKITNMQYHVIKEKKLPEAEAIRIFYKVVQIVERLHKLNIVHRDLKLGNIIFNKDTRDVTLANFCLGKHLSSEKDLLKDQRGSPAYISPDVISGKPYLGKPSDMWSLGVVLYTMLYGQFPFYDQSPTELFRKIKLGEFQIPVDVNVSKKTVELIQSLLVLDASKRLTATNVLGIVRSIIADEQSLMSDSDLQVVPDCHPGAERPKKRTYSERCGALSDAAFADIAALLAKAYEPADVSELEDFEPFRKMTRIVANPKMQIPGVASHIRLDELQRIHAMYMARKLKEAASLGKNSGSLVPEDLATHLSSSSSNGFNKSAATNLDSARVPESIIHSSSSADAMIPTSGGGLESRDTLFTNDRTFNRSNSFFAQNPFELF